MQIDGVSSALNTAQTKQVKKDELGKDDFLKLLVTQLQHQDPLNPTDNTEFVAQLAQFSTLEGITNLQKTTENAKSSIDAMQSLNTASLIGKSVKAEGDKVEYTGNYPAALGFSLSGSADSVKVLIRSAGGTLVRSIDAGAKAAGDYSAVWDGKDNNGIAVKPGTYSFSIAAGNADKSKVETKTYITGPVSGVNFDAGATNIMVGAVPVQREQIKTIY